MRDDGGVVSRTVTVRSLTVRSLALTLCASLATAASTRAQSPPAGLLQVEVGDSIGLPLPDATIETFTLMQGGVFLEWVSVRPEELPEGVYLLRFSYPGYRSAVFSVPLKKGNRVSLRVRLGAEPDTTQRGKAIVASPVRAIGLFLEGRASTDIIRTRHVLERDAVERAKAPSLGELIRGAKEMGVIVTPGAGSNYRISSGGAFSCFVPVMLNGDRRWLFAFSDINQRYQADEVEAAEYIPRAAARPFARRPEEVECGLLLLWLRPR